MKPRLPIDFNLVRATLAKEIERVTGTICVLEEPAYQGAQRPCLPYFSFKIIVPGAKSGDDSQQFNLDSRVFNRGGQRKMSLSIHCYSVNQEDAYSLMTLLQGSFELFQTQANLTIGAGIAVWTIGTVVDLSQLLDTGYEGRAQLDLICGIASNLTEDLGAIETVDLLGTVTTDSSSVTTISIVAPK